MTAENPTPAFQIPRDLYRSFEVLAPMFGKDAGSRAAMALWSWSKETGPGLGLRAPRATYRDRTHIDRKKNIAAFEVVHELENAASLRSLHFTDFSCAVLYDPGPHSDVLYALPAVFQTFSEPRNPKLFFRAHNRKRSRKACDVAFRPEGGTGLVPLIATEAEVAATPSLNTHPALCAVRRDMERLAPLFEQELWIAAPGAGPYERSPLTPKRAKAHGFPEAAGHIPFWPEFLPHEMTSADERRAIQKFMDDFTSWVAYCYKGRLSNVHYTAYLAQGDRRALFMLHATKPTWPTSTGFPIDFVAIEADKCRLPVPLERLRGLAWNTRQTKQSVQRVNIAEGCARDLSHHEALAMRARFGALREDAFAEKECAT